MKETEEQTEVIFPAPCEEPWERMSDKGISRFCERCSTTVHDLQAYSPTELNALLGQLGKVCVRARLNERGEISLRPVDARPVRKFVATLGGGLALMSASAPVAAKPKEPNGEIAGTVTDSDWATYVTAKSDDGKTYATKVKRNGKFKLKNVPPGTYQLSYSAACAEPWDGEKVVVEKGKTTDAHASENYGCIVVGLIEIKHADG